MNLSLRRLGQLRAGTLSCWRGARAGGATISSRWRRYRWAALARKRRQRWLSLLRCCEQLGRRMLTAARRTEVKSEQSLRVQQRRKVQRRVYARACWTPRKRGVMRRGRLAPIPEARRWEAPAQHVPVTLRRRPHYHRGHGRRFAWRWRKMHQAQAAVRRWEKRVAALRPPPQLEVHPLPLGAPLRPEAPAFTPMGHRLTGQCPLAEDAPRSFLRAAAPAWYPGLPMEEMRASQGTPLALCEAAGETRASGSAGAAACPPAPALLAGPPPPARAASRGFSHNCRASS